MPEPKQSLRTIFLEALEIEDARQRVEYLAQACGTDAALRQKITELIAADSAAGGFLVTAHDEEPSATVVSGGAPPGGTATEPTAARIPNPATSVVLTE